MEAKQIVRLAQSAIISLDAALEHDKPNTAGIDTGLTHHQLTPAKIGYLAAKLSRSPYVAVFSVDVGKINGSVEDVVASPGGASAVPKPAFEFVVGKATGIGLAKSGNIIVRFAKQAYAVAVTPQTPVLPVAGVSMKDIALAQFMAALHHAYYNGTTTPTFIRADKAHVLLIGPEHVASFYRVSQPVFGAIQVQFDLNSALSERVSPRR